MTSTSRLTGFGAEVSSSSGLASLLDGSPNQHPSSLHYGTSSRQPTYLRPTLTDMVVLQTDSIPASSIRRIAKELNALRAAPPEGIRVVVNEDDISQFTAWVQGPGQSLVLLCRSASPGPDGSVQGFRQGS